MGIALCLVAGLFGTVRSVAADSSDEKIMGGGVAVTNPAGGLGYSVELYDCTNGLPTSDANTVLCSSDGFIWIGGYSGLIRYDGTSFDRMTEPSSITNVNTLFEDSKGRIWVGTNDNGVVAFHYDESFHYGYTNGLTTSSIRSIAEDGDGNIIIGASQGLYYVDPEMEFHKLDDPLLNNSYIRQLVSNEEGTIYGVTHDGTMFRIRNLKVDSCVHSTELGWSAVTTLFPDPKNDGGLYLGSAGGQFGYGSFDDNFQSLKEIEARFGAESVDSEASGEETDKPINWIDYAAGRIWVLRDDVIGWLDDAHGFHSLSNLPMNSSVVMMEEDYEGNIWFASTRQGVMKIVSNKFSDITEHNALDNKVVNSTCLHEGHLYIATDDGLQILDEYYNIVNNELTKKMKGTRIRCLMEDDKGNLWVSAYTNDIGLVCYGKDHSIKYYDVKNGMISNQVRSTRQTSDGSIMVATDDGFAVLKDGKVERKLDEESGMDNTLVLAMEEYDGKYYIGTDGGGIYEVDGNSIIHKGREDGLTSDVILRMKNDPERGVCWIITSNSLQYMKDGEIHDVEKFPYNNNYDIYFDDKGNAWVLASNGFYVVKAQDMIDKEYFEYLQYDYNSGLPSMPTVNAYSALAEDGTLYVSAREGVYAVNINTYFDLTHEIKLLIPCVEADGKNYYADESGTIFLPSSADSITVYAYALTYSMQNPKIRYQLEGVDKQETEEFKRDMTPVRYTNLKGGDFQFRLSVTNNSTGEVQQSTEIIIKKSRDLFEEWWFRIVIAIIGVSLLVLIIAIIFHRKRIRYMRIEEEKQKRTKQLIREITTAFSKTIDMKDEYTKGHSSRVADYTVMLARELGYDEETLEDYHNIALLHDIGKIGVPAEVLNKAGKLTDEEFKIIKSHSNLGYNALKEISIMPELATGARDHHERPDGKGYPNGKSGDEIPRVAQIIAVADTFDAMYSDRPYRKRMNFDKAVSIIKEVSGTQLTSDVVDAFLRLVERGEFRAPDDDGGGTTEDINNIRKKFEADEKKEDQASEEKSE